MIMLRQVYNALCDTCATHIMFLYKVVIISSEN